jgi:hypothetical protein
MIVQYVDKRVVQVIQIWATVLLKFLYLIILTRFINDYFPQEIICTKTNGIDDCSQRLIGAVNGFLVVGILTSFASLVVSANAIRHVCSKVLMELSMQDTCYDCFRISQREIENHYSSNIEIYTGTKNGMSKHCISSILCADRFSLAQNMIHFE